MLIVIHLAGLGRSLLTGRVLGHLVRLVVVYPGVLIMRHFTGLGMSRFSMFFMVHPSLLIVCHRGRLAVLVLFFGCCCRAAQ